MDIPEGITCVIFDLDGTLANFPIDYVAMRAELKTLAAAHGKRSDFRPLISEARRLAASDRGFLNQLFAIIDRHELASVEKAIPNRGVMELYGTCKKKGLKRAILTRNGRKLVEAFLKRFGLEAPDIMCSRDDAVNLKPHPEQMEFVLKRLKVAPSKALLIGDSEHDERLAIATDVFFYDCKKVIS